MWHDIDDYCYYKRLYIWRFFHKQTSILQFFLVSIFKINCGAFSHCLNLFSGCNIFSSSTTSLNPTDYQDLNMIWLMAYHTEFANCDTQMHVLTHMIEVEWQIRSQQSYTRAVQTHSHTHTTTKARANAPALWIAFCQAFVYFVR